MKLLIYSDLHLEFSNFTPPKGGFDVVILAGDIHLGDKGVRWARHKFPEIPVIYICGNHEYYHHEINAVQSRIRAETEGTNIHFCENESMCFGDTRFICATLWTDFAIQGDKELNMLNAARCMNDYHLISLDDDILEPRDTVRFHHDSRKFLEAELKKENGGTQKTVVVTHHAPSVKSLRRERIGMELDPAYGSSLEPLMFDYQPELWIHGHTHESADYWVGSTRVFSNPRGYSSQADGDGNWKFERVCIIDL